MLEWAASSSLKGDRLAPTWGGRAGARDAHCSRPEPTGALIGVHYYAYAYRPLRPILMVQLAGTWSLLPRGKRPTRNSVAGPRATLAKHYRSASPNYYGRRCMMPSPASLVHCTCDLVGLHLAVLLLPCRGNPPLPTSAALPVFASDTKLCQDHDDASLDALMTVNLYR